VSVAILWNKAWLHENTPCVTVAAESLAKIDSGKIQGIFKSSLHPFLLAKEEVLRCPKDAFMESPYTYPKVPGCQGPAFPIAAVRKPASERFSTTRGSG
jgi:hypothetical protein